MADGDLNPFIERNALKTERRGSLSPAVPSIFSPQFTVINGDLVLGGGKVDAPGACGILLSQMLCHATAQVLGSCDGFLAPGWKL